MDRGGLRDDEWDRIKDFLPGREGHVGGTAPDNRRFVDAVLCRYRTGIPWRDLPAHFGSWKSTHQRFSRWCKSGVFDRVLKHLAGEADAEYVMIDATIVRAHQHSAGARKKGRGPSHRTFPGRPDNQNSCSRRRLGQSDQTYSDGGARPRRSHCAATARRRRLRRAARRQGLRCRRPDRTAAGRGNRDCHSAKEQSQRKEGMRLHSLQRAQLDRALLRKTQAIPGNSDTIR